MRWEALFADLLGQWDAEQRAEDDARIADLAELEMGRTRVADRLRARLGRPLTVRLLDGVEVSGQVLDAAPQWVLLGSAERRSLVPAAAVAVAWPLGPVAPEAGVVEGRLGVTHVLRAIAREGARVRVLTTAGDLRGHIVRVGADHLDLATGADAGRSAVTVVLASVLLVEST